jgi:hypothetical protein
VLITVLVIYSESKLYYNNYNFWWGNLKERDRWGDPSVDGRIMLR